MSSREAPTEVQTDSDEPPSAAEARVPGLTVLYHPRLERAGERALLTRLASGGRARLSRLEPGFAAPGSPLRAPLGDSRLSRGPIHLRAGRAPGSVVLERGECRASVVVDGERLDERLELAAERLEAGVVLLLGGRVVLLLHRLDPLVPAGLPSFGMIGESPEMLRVRREIQHVADLEVPVLLRGETGTGKELAARALHDAGPRRDGPFVAVSLAALPPSLASAELFGAARGAFTGAERRREGFFARAHGGTLFLDEVGEAPPELQALLLRALETGEVQALGEERPRRVDVRVISATDADLAAAVRAGGFRAPLLYRLAGFVLRLPPLRARRDDIGRLLAHFLRQELESLGEADRLEPGGRPWLPAALVARLAAHPWPGNVRELRNAVRQLVIAHRDLDEVPRDTPLEPLLAGAAFEAARLPAGTGATTPPSPADRPAARRPADVREAELVAALKRHRWRLQETADALGVPRSSLYRMIERCPAVRTAGELERGEVERALERCEGSVERAAEALEVSEVGLRRRLRRLGLS